MKKYLLFVQSLLLATAVWVSLPGHATSVEVSAPRPAIPPNIIINSNRPMVMLAASKDHSLFGPIYTDFEDVDGDNVIDTTFIPTFKYYGYFDSTKCYDYSSSQFVPAVTATQVDTTVGTKTLPRYTCPSTQSYWSGNFLNWASMTRLDVIRKILYGGTRSTDASGNTILERAKLNFDAHSFVKYYRGTDIRDYTPFTTVALTKSTGQNNNIYAGLSICNTGSADSSTASSNAPVMRMVRGNVRFWATVEIEVCRWRDNYSSGTFGPKLARYYQDADKGNGGVAHEITIPSISTDGATYTSSGSTIGPEMIVRVKACVPGLIGDEHCQAFPSSSTTNFKPYGLFQEFGYSTTGAAARSEFGLITGSYDKNYTAGALRKNMGDFADEINSSTGIFCHSASSGCATTLAAPDGRTTGVGAIKTFDSLLLNDRTSQKYATSGTPSSVSEGALSSWGNPIGEMLVQALQYYAYNGTSPTPTNPSTSTKDTALGLPMRTWSDPLSNSNTTRQSLYGNAICRPLHTLLLSNSSLSFDGQAATAFATLPNAPNIATYTDRVGDAENITNTLRSVGSVTGGYGTSCSAKTVGNLSNVSGICPEAPAMGGTYQVAGAALYGNTNQIRTVTNPPTDLANVKDALKVKTLAASLTGGAPRIDILVPGTSKHVYITPESVQGGGSLSAPLTFASISAGSTYGAFIVTWNDVLMGGDYDMDITGFIRYDLISNPSGGWDIKVTTDIPGVCGGAAGTHGFSIIGVKNSTGASADGRYLTHQHYSSGVLSGMPSTSEYLCGDSTYRAQTSTLFSGTYANTVCNVTGTTGATGDPGIPNLNAYCTVKNVDYPVSMTFHMEGVSNSAIEDPLYYAAKYGDFDSSTKSNNNTYTNLTIPPDVSSWDKYSNTDGTLGGDGQPDGYFLARRPDLLEQQLRKALDSLAKASNAAPVTPTSNLSDGSHVYEATFDSTAVTGEINPLLVQTDGTLIVDASIQSAGKQLRILTSGTDGTSTNKGNSRKIITNYGNKSSSVTSPAAAFRWEILDTPTLPPDFITQITTASTNTLITDNAQRLVKYMRGDQSLEGISIGLRSRGDNMLGPIVSATPWIQTPPSASFLETQSPGYKQFVTDHQDRPNLLWAAANDGMLHAFDPSTLAEKFAYVPGMIANRLAEIPLQRGTVARTRITVNGTTSNFTTNTVEAQPSGTVWAYVDGNPFTADAKLGITIDATTGAEKGTWYTYLFNALGRGGRGVFALDVTNTTGATDWSILNEGNANSIFKWQFSADDDVQDSNEISDLGYIVSDIGNNANSGQANPVAKLNNGKFALLLNNGPQSASGKAALYLLFIDGPDPTTGKWTRITSTKPTGQYVKIVADVGPNNGLSKPIWIDRDNNGTADVVYAGDLKGNLWKFDISSATPSEWAVAYKTSDKVTNRPLFTAQYSTTANGVTTTTALPITAAPEYVYPAFDGLIINFGTGNAFETGDFPKAGVPQRFYGIWDQPAFASSQDTGPLIPSNASLVKRTYSRDANGDVTVTADSTSSQGVATFNSINWTSQYGWYFDLPGTSEAVLSDPDLQAGYLVFSSVRPKTDTNVCNSTPNSTLYIIDPISGRTTRAGLLNSSGATVAGIAVSGQKWVVVNDNTSAVRAIKSCTGGTAGCVNGGLPPAANPDQICKAVVDSDRAKHTICYNPLGRVQWREIPGLRTDK